MTETATKFWEISVLPRGLYECADEYCGDDVNEAEGIRWCDAHFAEPIVEKDQRFKAYDVEPGWYCLDCCEFYHNHPADDTDTTTLADEIERRHAEAKREREQKDDWRFRNE